MKAENMKLLDLQTGKYLELGNDWLYGGDHISIIPTHYLGFGSTNPIADAKRCKKDETQDPLKTLCEMTGTVVYGGRYVLIVFKEYCDEELRKILEEGK